MTKWLWLAIVPLILGGCKQKPWSSKSDLHVITYRNNSRGHLVVTTRNFRHCTEDDLSNNVIGAYCEEAYGVGTEEYGKWKVVYPTEDK